MLTLKLTSSILKHEKVQPISSGTPFLVYFFHLSIRLIVLYVTFHASEKKTFFYPPDVKDFRTSIVYVSKEWMKKGTINGVLEYKEKKEKKKKVRNEEDSGEGRVCSRWSTRNKLRTLLWHVTCLLKSVT